MLQTILLVVVPTLHIWEALHKGLEVHNLARIVCGDSWTLQALTKDLVTGPEALRVEGSREDLALDLAQNSLA